MQIKSPPLKIFLSLFVCTLLAEATPIQRGLPDNAWRFSPTVGIARVASAVIQPGWLPSSPPLQITKRSNGNRKVYSIGTGTSSNALYDPEEITVIQEIGKKISPFWERWFPRGKFTLTNNPELETLSQRVEFAQQLDALLQSTTEMQVKLVKKGLPERLLSRLSELTKARAVVEEANHRKPMIQEVARRMKPVKELARTFGNEIGQIDVDRLTSERREILERQLRSSIGAISDLSHQHYGGIFPNEEYQRDYDDMEGVLKRLEAIK